jgi:hypothetical protein
MSDPEAVSYRIWRCHSDGERRLTCGLSNPCNLHNLLVPTVQLGFGGHLAVDLAVKMAVEVPVENVGRNKR